VLKVSFQRKQDELQLFMRIGKALIIKKEKCFLTQDSPTLNILPDPFKTYQEVTIMNSKVVIIFTEWTKNCSFFHLIKTSIFALNTPSIRT
jgi:hypothetical protein